MRCLPLLLLLLCFTALPYGKTQADTPNTKRLTEVPISDAPSYAKRALVIGIDQYDYCNPLGGNCGLDAKAFANLLQTKFGFSDVVLMTDDASAPRLRPTESHIKRALQTLYDGLTPGESEVVVFYSGHGTRATSAAGDRDYLVPSDGDPSDVPGTCIDYEAFRSRIETKNPLRALLITDACRDLLGGKGVGGKGFGGAGTKAVADPQIAELRSCLPGQTSRVAEGEFTGSVFTHYLVLGLQGDPDAAAPGTNQVTFDSLNRYLKGRVSQYVASHFNDTQTPNGLATLGEMLLARAASPVVVTPSVIPPVVTPPIKRVLTAAEQQAANARLLALWSGPDGEVNEALAKSLTAAAVRQALVLGADINCTNKDGRTLLMIAAGYENVPLIHTLLRDGANIEFRDKTGRTAVIQAAYFGKTNALNALLNNGADKEATDAQGNTALGWATEVGRVDAVKALLNARVNVNAKHNGWTALMTAAFLGEVEIVKALLKAGAKTNFPTDTKGGLTALYNAEHPIEGLPAAQNLATIAALKAAGAKE